MSYRRFFRPAGGVSHTSPARPGPPNEPSPRGPAPPPAPGWLRWLVPFGLLLVWLVVGSLLLGDDTTELDYSEFLTKVDAGQVEQVVVDPDGQVEGTLTDGTEFRTQVPTAFEPSDLPSRLEEHDVTIGARGPSLGLWVVATYFLPVLLLLGLFWWMGRSANTQMTSGIMGFGRSRLHVVDSERPDTSFEDVAGYEGVKREVAELIDFLRSPERFRRAGAIAPRGVLMMGPPGTGKTLLARAVAGEADVPFLSVTGSSFVEMFVGVGAARVRDLFTEARKRAPCIVFIDELDALGSRRAGGAMVSNDEREQTLNQLLAEMDGFDPTEGIAVLAATNRPDALDPALLRPGRFDRQVVVPLPTQQDRQAILSIHARGKQLAPDVDLADVARGTPGFSGADLANLINEAAINAARDDRAVITAEDLETARERIILGRREDSNVLLPSEQRAVAVHEAGHAMVAALSEHADPVAKVTILPAGMALGATHQLPLDERHLFGERHLRDALAVRLGGRAAELIVLGEGSTGAANDLTAATDLATKMVREYGLSPEVGPVGYGARGPMFLGGEELHTREYAEQTQRIIDEEVARLLREAEQRALNLLRGHRRELDAFTDRLLEEETVDGEAVYELLAKPVPKTPERPAPEPRTPNRKAG